MMHHIVFSSWTLITSGLKSFKRNDIFRHLIPVPLKDTLNHNHLTDFKDWSPSSTPICGPFQILKNRIPPSTPNLQPLLKFWGRDCLKVLQLVAPFRIAALKARTKSIIPLFYFHLHVLLLISLWFLFFLGRIFSS